MFHWPHANIWVSTGSVNDKTISAGEIWCKLVYSETKYCFILCKSDLYAIFLLKMFCFSNKYKQLSVSTNTEEEKRLTVLN